MIIYIKPKELINNNAFVREPIDDITKEIMKSSQKEIILDGGRGIGKTVLLTSIENKGLGTENQTVYTHFESIVHLDKEPNERFNEKLFRHYYELQFSWKLLNYVKNNYGLIYESNFKDIEEMLHILSNNTDNYINNICYSDNAKLQRYLSTKEITSEIINRMKRVLGIDSLNLAIDRFDWTNGSSAFVQQLLCSYFELFNKTILTTDDELAQKDSEGHFFMNIIYGTDINTVKQIIVRRIKLYNEKNMDSKKYIDKKIITDDIYRMLIDKTKGNISLMFASLREMADLIDWYNGNINNLEEKFDNTINEQIEKSKQLKKIDAHPPKLHI